MPIEACIVYLTNIGTFYGSLPGVSTYDECPNKVKPIILK